MHDTGGADAQSAFLRAVVVGPAATSPLTVDLDRMMRDAGHDVTLLTGARTVGGKPGGIPPSRSARPSAIDRSALAEPSWAPAPAPRPVPLLAWSRLDTWARTGRRLRGVDVIVVVHSGLRSVPALLALLHGARASGSARDDGPRPRTVLVAAAPLARPGRTARPGRPALRGWHVGTRLTAALVQRVDAVLVHDDETAAVATILGAERVRVTARPVSCPEQPAVGARGGTPGESARPTVVGIPAPATAAAFAAVRSGAPRGGRTWVAIGAVAREVRHGLALGSRFASNRFATYAMRGVHTQHRDVERTRAGRATVGRAGVGRAPVGRLTVGRSTVGRAPGGRAPLGRAAVTPWTGVGEDVSEPDTGLSAEWAHYVGVVESLASPFVPGVLGDPEAREGDGVGVGPDAAGPVAARLTAVVEGLWELVRALRTPNDPVPLQRSDLPDWVVPTDVLVDAADGDEAKVVARELGLPRVHDGAQAWSALGALAAIIRIVDDGHRRAVVVDESGSRSPLTRWARAVGFAPVSLGLGGPRADLAAVDLGMETLDVIARVHPGGCDADDVDELIGSSSWLLRPGGILVVTLPLGPPDAPGAIAPADVRGVVAGAHGFGFTLVGDLDGELTALMGAAAVSAASADTAYGLVRLTFRRQ